jgi:hypothetical protein
VESTQGLYAAACVIGLGESCLMSGVGARSSDVTQPEQRGAQSALLKQARARALRCRNVPAMPPRPQRGRTAPCRRAAPHSAARPHPRLTHAAPGSDRAGRRRDVRRDACDARRRGDARVVRRRVRQHRLADGVRQRWLSHAGKPAPHAQEVVGQVRASLDSSR